MPTELTPREAIIKLNRIRTNTGERPPEIDMAIKALRKQIPQKLIVTTSTKRCPSCNKQLTNKGCIHSKYNYCKWCGQALDWSEPKCKT